MAVKKEASISSVNGNRVTITDIARVFDVSAMTVSKALNRKPGVSLEKADAIRSYANSMGYRPSHAARSLLNGRTHTVGICIRESQTPKPWGYPWLYNLMREIGVALKLHNIHTQTCIAPGGAKESRQAVERFMETGVESVIVGPLGMLEEYHDLSGVFQHCAHVLAFDAIDDLPIDHVKWNTYQGGQLIAQYFAQLGHKEILALGVSELELNSPSLHVQFNGFKDAAKLLGLHIQSKHIIKLNNVDEIKCKLESIYKQPNPPTAVFCHNDWIAMHAIQSLTELGLKVPDDVSVTGFDDLPVASIANPALTTVGYDIKVYAQKISQIVASRINNRFGSTSENKVLPPIIRWELNPSLRIRKSTASNI